MRVWEKEGKSFGGLRSLVGSAGFVLLIGVLVRPAYGTVVAGLIQVGGSPTPTATPTPAPASTPDPTPTPATVTSDGIRIITTCNTRIRESVQLGADLATTKGDCLIVQASGVTVDGAGHSVSAPSRAVSWVNQSDVTVRNLVSKQGIQIYGPNASRNLVEDVDVGPIGIYQGDDNVVRNSKMTALKIQGMYNDPPLRTVVTGNAIISPAGVLVYISPGNDTCGASDTLFENNFVQGTATDPNAADQALLYVRCGRNNTITGNTLRSTGPGPARGIYLRDEADDNLIEDNDVWLNTTDRGGFHISSGNDSKHHPRGNIIHRNLFRSDHGRSMWIQAYDTRENTFADNLFWANGPEGNRVKGGTDNVFDHNTFVNEAHGNLLLLESFAAPGNVYTNNLFVNSGPSTYYFSGQNDLSGYHGSHNVFFDRLGPAQFYGTNLAGWQAETGQDLDSIEADPDFVDEAGGDFGLGEASAAGTAASDGGPVGAFPAAPAVP